MTDNLIAKFGPNFQKKVLALLILDFDFIKRIHNTLKPEYFDSDGDVWLLNVIFEYFHKYNCAVTFDYLDIVLNQSNLPNTQKIMVIETIKKVQQICLDFKDQKFVKDEIIHFCKTQGVKRILINSVDKLDSGDIDSIVTDLEKAIRTSDGIDMGMDLKLDVAQRLRIKRHTVPSPWDAINNITEGGFGPGELILYIGGPGAGKTWLLCYTSAHFAKMGKNVLHLSLELSEFYTSKRFDTILTNIPLSELAFNEEKIVEAYERLEGFPQVKAYPTKGASVNDIKHYFEIYIAETGRRPDVIVVDYADLLKPAYKNKEQRHDIDDIFKDLRGLAGELGIPIVSATQANRSSVESDIITSDQVADSFSKIMISDFIMSIARKTNDKLLDSARYHIIKNRFGVDGVTFNGILNTTRGIINIAETGTDLSKKLANDMEKNVGEQKRLKSRFDDLMKSSPEIKTANF